MERILSEPSRLHKMSETTKTLWKNEEYRQKNCSTKRKKEYRNKMSDVVKNIWKNRNRERFGYDSMIKNKVLRPFSVVSSNGKVFYIESISRFSKENSLHESRMRLLRDGKTKKHKGYKLHMSDKQIEENNIKFSNIVKQETLNYISVTRVFHKVISGK